jgi:hypothetical protein
MDKIILLNLINAMLAFNSSCQENVCSECGLNRHICMVMIVLEEHMNKELGINLEDGKLNIPNNWKELLDEQV